MPTFYTNARLFTARDEKVIEQGAGIFRPGGRLRVKLNAHDGSRPGSHAFVRSVIDVDEPWFAVCRERLIANGVTVVLTRDIATAGPQVPHRLIDTAMAVRKLEGVAADGE